MNQVQTVDDPTVSFSPNSDEPIVERVRTFVKRFVVIPNEAAYLLLSAWIVATHLKDCFDFMGLLFIHSPEKQSGKTRLLEVMHPLVWNSSGIECSPTKAVLFRTAQGHTQLLDEADGWHDVAELQSVLNSGYTRSGQITRCEQKAGGGAYIEKSFNTYAPRVIAGIGDELLTETIKDRTYFIELVRKLKEEPCERVRGRQFRKEAEALRAEIDAWVVLHRNDIAEEYEAMRTYSYLAGFADRTIDISEGLAALLEVDYRDRPDLLGQVRQELAEAISQSRHEKNESKRDHEIISAILQRFFGDEIREMASTIAGKITDLVADCTEHEIGQVLRKYGFESKSIRNGHQVRKCYVIQRAKLLEIVRRYVM